MKGKKGKKSKLKRKEGSKKSHKHPKKQKTTEREEAAPSQHHHRSPAASGLKGPECTTALDTGETRTLTSKIQIGPQLPPAEENVIRMHEESPQRTVKGPVRPPQAFLDASSVLCDEPVVGPMPLDEGIDSDNISDNVKFEEVKRILAMVDSFALVDPFKVLGVEANAGDSDVKKKYWRLSLLVHPDKCSHPRAQEAFQTVNKAFQKLQDASGRASFMAEKLDGDLRKEAELEIKRQQRKDEWRAVRGELGKSQVPRGPQQRQTWMTDLPPEKQNLGTISRVSRSSFSQRGVFTRGDTSGWTNTPASLSQAATQVQIRDSEHPKKVMRPSLESRTKKSLVEQHIESQEKSGQKLKSGEYKQQGTGFKGRRPFDREKDLEIPRSKAKDWNQVIMDARGLKQKFQTGK